MTRINLVPPSELSRQHLIAEYRELPRIFGLVRKAIERGELPTDKRNPITYTLGIGHCRFFYSRLRFLQIRQYSLIAEMLKRGYAVTHKEVVGMDEFLAGWANDYIPTEEALVINRARIKERSNVTA